jgi:hypothetical protein
MVDSNASHSKLKMEKVKAEQLLGRFRSKEDLYRYLT